MLRDFSVGGEMPIFEDFNMILTLCARLRPVFQMKQGLDRLVALHVLTHDVLEVDNPIDAFEDFDRLLVRVSETPSGLFSAPGSFAAAKAFFRTPNNHTLMGVSCSM